MLHCPRGSCFQKWLLPICRAVNWCQSCVCWVWHSSDKVKFPNKCRPPEAVLSLQGDWKQTFLGEKKITFLAALLEGQFDRSTCNTLGVDWGRGAEDRNGGGDRRGKGNQPSWPAETVSQCIFPGSEWLVTTSMLFSPKRRILEPGETPSRKPSLCPF